MNKSILTHSVWLVVAAGAFAGGMAIKGGSDKSAANRDVNVNVSGGGGLSAITKPKSEKAGSGNSGEAVDAGADVFGAQRSTNAIIADYLASNDALEQNFLFAQLLLGVNADNAAQIYESLKGKLTGRDGGRQMSLFFQSWGKVDGAAAIAAATEGGTGGGGPGRGPGNGFSIGSVLTGWASTDSEAAKTWLATVEDERQKGFYTFGLINGMAQSDPNAATDYVLELAAAQAASGEEPQRAPWGGDFASRYIDVIASEQIKKGVSAATAWADSLPEGSIKASAFDEIAENYVRTDIDGAKAWIGEHANAEYAQDAVREVAEQLAREDPRSALEWGDSLPPEAQASAYAETMGRWTREDAEAASKHLATMEASPSRDAAVGSFATALAFERDDEKRDPESAATWAATIQDEAARTKTLTDVARSWMRTDQAAATAWLPTSGLPAEAQAEITAPRAPGDDRGGRDFGRGRGR